MVESDDPPILTYERIMNAPSVEYGRVTATSTSISHMSHAKITSHSFMESGESLYQSFKKSANKIK